MSEGARRTPKQIVGALQIWGGGAGLVAVLSNTSSLTASSDGILILGYGSVFFAASIGAGILLALRREWGSEASILLQALQIPSLGGKVLYHVYSGAAIFLNLHGPDPVLQFNLASGIRMGYEADEAFSLFGFNVLAACIMTYLAFAAEDDIVKSGARNQAVAE